jgi:hypothetical protein
MLRQCVIRVTRGRVTGIAGARTRSVRGVTMMIDDELTFLRKLEQDVQHLHRRIQAANSGGRLNQALR